MFKCLFVGFSFGIGVINFIFVFVNIIVIFENKSSFNFGIIEIKSVLVVFFICKILEVKKEEMFVIKGGFFFGNVEFVFLLFVLVFVLGRIEEK